MPPAEPPRSFRRALALGLIQGPTELLPISSSAHTRLIPWLAGCIPWVIALVLIGESVGSEWQDVRKSLAYLDYVVLAAIIAGVIYAIVRRRRTPRKPAENAAG